MVMGVLCFLHPLSFHGIAKHIQQVYDLHILVGGFLQRIVHPAVGFPANINKQVAVRNLYDIVSRRLVAVQVDAVIEQQGEVCVPGFVTKNFPYPIVLRENRCDDFYFLRLCGRFCSSGRGGSRLRISPGSGASAASNKCAEHNNGKHNSDKLFH